MRVTVRSYGVANETIPPDGTEVPVDVPEGCTVADLVERVRAVREHLWMVAVNDSAVGDDHVLGAGDRVSLFTHITGG